MAFLIDYDEMTALGFGIQTKTSAWGEQLTDVQTAIQSIAQMGSFRGAAAQNAKCYLSEVHAMILVSIGEVFSELCSRFLLYKDGYYTQIDPDLHAKLCECTLDGLLLFFNGSRGNFDSARQRLKKTADSISDIMPASAPPFYAVSGDYDKVILDQGELKEDVLAYESLHLSQDFTNFENLAAALRQFIAEYQAKGGEGVSAYVPGSFQAALSFPALGQALQDAYTDRQALSGALLLAGQNEQERFKLLEAEWAKEREEQGWLNLLVGALVVVGGIVCIVATAGLATPLVVAGAAAGLATIAYGASNMFEAGGDIYYGSIGDYSTAAFNPLRDTVFEWAFGEEGKQQAWDTFGTIAIATSTVLTLGAGAITAGSAAAQAGTSVSRAVGVYGLKTAASIGAGMLGGYAGKEAALAFGASETVADIVGTLSGTVSGIVAGYGAERIDQARNLSGFYKPSAIVAPEPGSMSDLEARKWYLEQEGKIDSLIDKNAPLEQQAQQAFELRNQIRSMARDGMANQAKAAELYGTNPNLSWDEIVSNYKGKGFSGDDLYSEIIAASQRSNPEVNALYGLDPSDFMWAQPNVPNPFPYIFQATEFGVMAGIDLENR